ncbi:MAG TPA: hypothetical protein VMK12_09375 [Anaeromyxobacteraceae bacterium]|nr:hypothetical protein [Anaeromyxobacteraceae bacterium]
MLIAGAPGPASAVVIGDLAWDNIGKTLDAAAIEALLSDYDLNRAQFVAVETTDAVRDADSSARGRSVAAVLASRAFAWRIESPPARSC